MEMLIALVLLMPVAIIVLLIVNFTRTSNLKGQITQLHNNVDWLNRRIDNLLDDQKVEQGSTSEQEAKAQAQNGLANNSASDNDDRPARRRAAAEDLATRRQQAAYAASDSKDASQRAEVTKKDAVPETAQDAPSRTIYAPQKTEEPADTSQDNSYFKGLSIEDIIGGKLPIWIGGIALIFAAFFLVRYSIEAGLFGPRARSITAALFGLALVAASQFGSKLPRIGFAFDEDKRLGQSLAGAGIAILYATLYMASELYGLLPLIAAFTLVVVISALAFALALRHGPPTAIMGVVGGFSAPFVAGMDANNLPLLLSYLGVFMAALFALSLWQRWLWLLLMTIGGGGIWTITLISTALNGLPILGFFILAAAAAAIVTALRMDSNDIAPKAEKGKNNWHDNLNFDDVAIYLPQIVALVQLCILVPRMEFSPLGWAFLFALGALSLLLAWRDNRLWPLTALTAIGFIFPIIAGWYSGNGLEKMLGITLGYAALFSGVSHAWLTRKSVQHAGAGRWGLLALIPILIAYQLIVFQYQGPLAFVNSGFLGLILALPCAWIAWQFREYDEGRAISLPEAAAAVTVIMTGTGLIQILPGTWLAIIGVILAFGLALWGQFTKRRMTMALAFVPFGGAILAMLLSQEGALDQYLATLAGGYIQHDLLPLPTTLIIPMLVPALLMLAPALMPQSYAPQFHAPRPIRMAFAIGGGVFTALYALLLAKQPLAITSLEDFIAWGFTERALITLTIAAGGAALLKFARGFGKIAGLGLIALSAVRFVWFDLVMFNPVLREQAVGAWPLANMAVLLCAALTILFWWTSKQTLARDDASDGAIKLLQNWPMLSYGAALLMSILTLMVAVRQYCHGTVIAFAPVETTENYLYSAALLLLALAWIGYAILRSEQGSSRTLRQAGLALLTLVTLKVFLIDAAAMEGVLRILSFLGLGVALIVIGWAYRRLLARDRDAQADA